ncbi:predicted protein [Arabidopsis lyrata subsp. lyrata]|uniref:Predicted protein n=1 Tax=Arabidopsis lyrata subsp. lyrata TaxID=81972 RepID=D7LXK4_ARALL|nr:predicted protein [Arabidopsis lyrata subsp. lyrata]
MIGKILFFLPLFHSYALPCFVVFTVPVSALFLLDLPTIPISNHGSFSEFHVESFKLRYPICGFVDFGLFSVT